MKPSTDVRSRTAGYGQLFKRIWAHVRGPVLVDYDCNVGELPSGATIIVQLGMTDFHAYQFLVSTRRRRPDLKRIIVAHDPPQLPRTKLALTESISRSRAAKLRREPVGWARNDVLDREALSPSDRWVALSGVGCARLGEYLRRLGFHAPIITYVPHGLYAPAPQVRQRSARAPLCVGLFGYVATNQGLDTLVDAASIIAQAHGLRMVPRFLVAAGPGGAPATRGFSEAQRRIRERRLDSRFEFLGHLSKEQVSEFFRDIDVLAIPCPQSGAQSVSGAVHRAWTCGIPVLANHSPCLDELLADHPACLLGRPGKAQPWVDRLLRLQWDDAFWSSARRAVLDAQTRNSWQRVVEAFEVLLDSPERSSVSHAA